MTWTAKTAPRDDAADASQFLSRLGYVVLALAAPAGVVLYSLAIYLLFPIGVALIVLAALLDPPEGVGERMRGPVAQPPVLLGVAVFVWMAASIVWTPFPVEAWQHGLKIAGWAVGVYLAMTLTPKFARATDLYLFPIGLIILMLTIFVAFVANRHGAAIEPSRILEGGRVLVVLLFPAMGGLAARGRNGWARLLLILAFIYAFAIGSTPLVIALFVGFAALSFAVSDLGRTARDLSWIAAGLIALAPLVVLVLAPLARLMMNDKLPGLPAPYPSLALAFGFVTREWPRLITGHGFESIARGVQAGVLPAITPRGLLFQVWYELGVVGALLTAAGVWFAFRGIGRLAPRLAAYLCAALACNLTMGALDLGLSDMTWFTALGVGLIAADIAARSQYRTTRPSAENLAHF